MHLVDEADAVPVRSMADLLAYFDTAGKPVEQWRVGTEHELVGVITTSDQLGEAPPYDGPHGIGALFDAFAANGGKPTREDGFTIALSRGDAQLTIEPGGQFELAGRPVSDDRDFAADLRAYVTELGAASRPLGLAWLSTGLRPFGTRASIPWMPKQRYAVMRDYMPTVGTRGLDMMVRTATVQANLDFADEADAAHKMRALYASTSLLTALWAASPIVDEKPSEFQSYRAWIWRDTDKARAGVLKFAIDREDIFTAYTEWALDVPMYFLYRGGYKRVPAGFTFRQYMEHGYGDEHATRADWALHLSTLFPEGRLKKFIEVRGCDCGSLGMITALAPMMRGLLYDTTARTAAIELTRSLTWQDRRAVADDVPRLGFAAKAGAHTVGALAKELVAIAKDGLSRVAPSALDLLAPVEEIAESGRTQADAMLDIWKSTGGDRAAVIRALAHPGLGPA